MNREVEYFDALTRIAKGYKSADWLQRNSKLRFGLDYHFALEMLYDSLRDEASEAIYRHRRPKMAK